MSSASTTTHVDAPWKGTPSVKPRRSKKGSVGMWCFALTSIMIALSAPIPYLMPPEAQSGIGEYYANQTLPIKATLYLHIAMSGVALLLSPLQASTRIRRRFPAGHRRVGWVVTMSIVFGGASGMVVAVVSYAGFIGTAGFGLLAILWVLAAVTSVQAAKNRELARHREWALRTLALTYAAVTLRLWLIVLINLQFPTDTASSEAAFDRVYPIVTFLSWVPNLVFVEWMIRRRSRTARPSVVR